MIALVVFYDLGDTTPRKLFKVLSCVIYTIIDRYVCIDYLGTEIKKISDLRLGCTLKTKHEGMDYDNLFGYWYSRYIIKYVVLSQNFKQ